MKKYLIFTFLLLVYNVFLFGQMPEVVPLDHNPALQNRKPATLKRNDMPDALLLPFFDDFSYYWDTSYLSKPDKKLWMDDYVYINNHYPVEPRSNGVATFDALDADGNVYKNTLSTFTADTLTSRPIDLDGLTKADSVYLSFFYQPQGYGDNPDPGDSLIVQFWSPETRKWSTIWHTPGTALHRFKPVLLPVDRDIFLQKGFQFRFMNLVSLEHNKFNPGRRGNADHWNIDYVYLNKYRNKNDTIAYDITVIAPMKSLIKDYQSIPWKQLEDAIATNLESTVEITYRNNNISDNYVWRNFIITDIYNKNTVNLSPGGGENIRADEIITFAQNFVNPFKYTADTDSAEFEIKAYIDAPVLNNWKENDTVRFKQVFKDYFARDDGVPESGYGFSGYNAYGCAVACRYETFAPDFMKAVMIYFNPTYNSESAKYRFNIAVWGDDNGRPGELIYKSLEEYSPKTTGQFMRFNLERNVYVSKYYWIGWIQVTSGFLNVGFDRNFNDKGNLWFDNGIWRQDFHDGTLMIRPVMGQNLNLPTSVEQPAIAMDNGMKIYPNPTSHHIRIEFEKVENLTYSDYDAEIYDIAGRLHYRAQYTGEYIDVSNFEYGVYFVRMIHRKTGNAQTQKLIITK